MIIQMIYWRALRKIDKARLRYCREMGPTVILPTDTDMIERAGVPRWLGNRAIRWREQVRRYGRL